jgi:hypothetical protein
MGLINWFEREYPNGFYAVTGKRLVEWLYGHTIFAWTTNAIDRRVNSKAKWFAELYQLLWLLIAFLMLLLSSGHPSLFWFIVTGLVYRIYELVLFILYWLFIDRGPVHSVKRSLVSFLFNAVEIVVFFAAAYTARPCYHGFLLALYNSITTFVTIGPRNINEAEADISCMGLISLEVSMAYMLTAIVIGTLASAVFQRRT